MAVIWWIRRDFCLEDNLALLAALETGEPVISLYIDSHEEGENSRWWLEKALAELKGEVPLVYRCGDAVAELIRIVEETGAGQVFWNRCYEPAALQGDERVKEALKSRGVQTKTFNTQLLFEPWMLSKTYRVFTPFWKACLSLQVPQKPLPDAKKNQFFSGVFEE